jgi:rare lipoprotein A
MKRIPHFRTNALALFVAIAFITTSCSGGGAPFLRSGRRTSKSSHAVGVYKIGTPYQVDGVWYYPREDYSYSEVGVSSWYGPNFHNKLTANGEIFDMNMPTAAHRTLPLPSVVRVTNLENGRVAILTVNDRGPFVNNRIIDVSRRGAQLLGFLEKGTAKVRVEVLPEESRKLKRQAMGLDDGEELKTQFANSQTAPKAPKNIKPLVYSPKNNPFAEPEKEVAKPLKTSNLPPLANPRPLRMENIQNVKPVAKTSNFKSSSYSNLSNNTQASKTKVVQTQTLRKSTAGNVADNLIKAAPTKMVKANFVQAGAFSNYDNAVRLSKTLSSVGDAHISPVSVNGRTLYRVRVGPANTAGDAQTILKKVKAFGHSGARIVKDKVATSSSKLSQSSNVRHLINN